MSGRTATTNTRNVRYIFAGFSKVVAVIAVVTGFLFFVLVVESYLTQLPCQTYYSWSASTDFSLGYGRLCALVGPIITECGVIGGVQLTGGWEQWEFC